MMIRSLLPTDDFHQAAEVLFLADPYIFGDLFETQEQAGKFGPHLFQQDDNALFCINKTIIAEENQRILGILCYRNGCCHWSDGDLRSQYAALPPHFDRVSRQYFQELAAMPLGADSAECMFLAVHPAWRGRGLGQALLTHFLSLPAYHSFYLDVLTSNESAIKLYRKCGFHVCSEHPAYPPENSDCCFRMKAVPDRL